jgi:hypothetical protein
MSVLFIEFSVADDEYTFREFGILGISDTVSMPDLLGPNHKVPDHEYLAAIHKRLRTMCEPREINEYMLRVYSLHNFGTLDARGSSIYKCMQIAFDLPFPDDSEVVSGLLVSDKNYPIVNPSNTPIDWSFLEESECEWKSCSEKSHDSADIEYLDGFSDFENSDCSLDSNYVDDE